MLRTILTWALAGLWLACIVAVVGWLVYGGTRGRPDRLPDSWVKRREREERTTTSDPLRFRPPRGGSHFRT